MPSIYDLKPGFQALLRPLVNTLAHAGITANQVTISALALSVLAGAAIMIYPEQGWPLLLIPVALFIRMALNAIDGMLAREHHQQSALGAILNELGDVLADAALYLPLAFVSGLDPVWIVAVVVLAIVAEMTGVIAIQIGASRRYDGPMGKSDRAFVFGIIGLVLGLGYPVAAWVNYILIIMAILLVMTIINRSRRALDEVNL